MSFLIDYCTAPNCSTVCSSGSGSPKANGTQECLCIEVNKVTMVAEIHSTRIGYDKLVGYGSLKPDTYKGIKIQSFFSKILGDKLTTIVFESSSNIPDTLKVKINGTVFDFIKTTNGTSIFWKKRGKTFSNGQTYEIEFLN